MQHHRSHIQATFNLHVGLAAVLLIASSSLTGCGGGGGTDGSNPIAGPNSVPNVQPEQIQAVAAPSTPTITTPLSCDTSPTVPAVPGSTVSVATFGAYPNDGIDDTTAIQRALDSLTPGQWLVFPPGQYEHNRTLNVRVANVTLYGEGATLYGTNAADQALMVKADGDRVYGFTLKSNTDYRRSGAWTARLVIYGADATAGYISKVVLQGNRIVPTVNTAGSSGSNSSASAGILVYRGRDFTIASNTVARTLADGIHITAASRNGRVLNNTVRETGDDMIAMVTYLPATWRTTAQATPSWVDSYLAEARVQNILVANNTVNGQYWGRGISVVGGASISIKNNDVSNTTQAAGILVGREEVYNTTGVDNVIVSGNNISNVQTTTPVYVPTGPNFATLTASLATGVTAGHGGIEVHSLTPQSDTENAVLRPAITVSNVSILSNRISTVLKDGIRVGSYSYMPSVKNITVQNNTMSRVGLLGLTGTFLDSSTPALHCVNNTLDGGQVNSSLCTVQTPPTVTGATLDCSKF